MTLNLGCKQEKCELFCMVVCAGSWQCWKSSNYNCLQTADALWPEEIPSHSCKWKVCCPIQINKTFQTWPVQEAYPRFTTLWCVIQEVLETCLIMITIHSQVFFTVLHMIWMFDLLIKRKLTFGSNGNVYYSWALSKRFCIHSLIQNLIWFLVFPSFFFYLSRKVDI